MKLYQIKNSLVKKYLQQEILEKIDKKVYDLFNYNTSTELNVDELMSATDED